jgi:hypothetical protein
VWKLVFSWKPDNWEKMAGIHLTTHKKNYAIAFFNQFIVSLSAPALRHSVSTTFIEYRCQPPGRGGGYSHPSCSAKLNLLCKNGPKRKSWKNPWYSVTNRIYIYIPQNTVRYCVKMHVHLSNKSSVISHLYYNYLGHVVLPERKGSLRREAQPCPFFFPLFVTAF